MFLELPLSYLLWHYALAWADLWRVYTNIAWFLWNLFSIRLLISTLISPWRRLSEQKSKGSAGLLGKLIINTLTRIFGVIVRAGTIVTGLIALIVWTALYTCFMLLWIVMPLVMLVLIVVGFSGLMSALL